MNSQRKRSGERQFTTCNRGFFIVLWAIVLVVPACQQQKVEKPAGDGKPNYARQLPAGRSALHRITDPADLPDLELARRYGDVFLLEAIDESLRWFDAPSSRQFYPFDGFTHRQAKASLLAVKDLMQSTDSPREFAAQMKRKFNVYQSVGYDGSGTVLFTGYYAPIFKASRTRTSTYKYPLYKRPADLVTDPVTGEPKGRRKPDGTIVPYYTRREILESDMLEGHELVWMKDPLEAFIVHVNGSAKLHLRDGSIMHVGYAGKTDRPYTGLGESMVDAGLVDRDGLSLSAIKDVYQQKPQRVRELMRRNENFVFFTEYDGDNWPSGSLGVKVTPENTLATDKSVYPRGGLVLVDTQSVTFSRGTRRFHRFLLDQDTGGAIQAPGRADIYMGVGPSAEILAGGQYAEGSLYYLFLKPEYIGDYLPPEEVDETT